MIYQLINTRPNQGEKGQAKRTKNMSGFLAGRESHNPDNVTRAYREGLVDP